MVYHKSTMLLGAVIVYVTRITFDCFICSERSLGDRIATLNSIFLHDVNNNLTATVKQQMHKRTIASRIHGFLLYTKFGNNKPYHGLSSTFALPVAWFGVSPGAFLTGKVWLRPMLVTSK
jgi:hypothetical protein